MQISNEVTNARASLARYLAQPGCSQTELSVRSGVPQYTISKFKTGRIKSLTPVVRQMLKYANNGIFFQLDTLTNDPRIRSALSSAWDGSEEGAAIIASAINSLAPLLRGVRPK